MCKILIKTKGNSEIVKDAVSSMSGANVLCGDNISGCYEGESVNCLMNLVASISKLAGISGNSSIASVFGEKREENREESDESEEVLIIIPFISGNEESLLCAAKIVKVLYSCLESKRLKFGLMEKVGSKFRLVSYESAVAVLNKEMDLPLN